MPALPALEAVGIVVRDKDDNRGVTVQLFDKSWLTAHTDAADLQSNPSWEQDFHQLTDALRHRSSDAKALRRRMEEQLLGEFITISSRQVARFWFTLGCYYAEHHQFHDAYEAFFLCEDLVPQAEARARISVHIALADAARMIRFTTIAHVHYSFALNHLRILREQSTISVTDEFEQLECYVLLQRSQLLFPAGEHRTTTIDQSRMAQAQQDLSEAFLIVAHHVTPQEASFAKTKRRKKARSATRPWLDLQRRILDLSAGAFPDLYATFASTS
jgi:hypothetical protein